MDCKSTMKMVFKCRYCDKHFWTERGANLHERCYCQKNTGIKPADIEAVYGLKLF